MTKARDIASATTPNANAALLATFPHKNLIINGAMQVAQRGTSFTATGVFPVDRFKMDKNGANITSTQNALTSGDPYDEGFRFSAKMATTSTDSNSANYYLLRQRIEAQNLASCGWNYTSSSSYITLSSWIKSSIAGTYYIVIRAKDGTEQSYVHEYTLAANTWKKISFSMQGNSNITFNMDNGEGLEITFSPYLGTDYTSSSTILNAWGAWNVNTGFGRDYTHDFGDTSGNTFEITGVQLEVGNTATPFEHRSYGDELARCQRYYQKKDAQSAIFAPYASNDGYGVYWSTFPVVMRSSPTGSISLSGWFVGNTDTMGVNAYTASASNYTLPDYTMDAEL